MASWSLPGRRSDKTHQLDPNPPQPTSNKTRTPAQANVLAEKFRLQASGVSSLDVLKRHIYQTASRVNSRKLLKNPFSSSSDAESAVAIINNIRVSSLMLLSA